MTRTYPETATLFAWKQTGDGDASYYFTDKLKPVAEQDRIHYSTQYEDYQEVNIASSLWINDVTGDTITFTTEMDEQITATRSSDHDMTFDGPYDASGTNLWAWLKLEDGHLTNAVYAAKNPVTTGTTVYKDADGNVTDKVYGTVKSVTDATTIVVTKTDNTEETLYLDS